jgi:hypothetical protein
MRAGKPDELRQQQSRPAWQGQSEIPGLAALLTANNACSTVNSMVGVTSKL